MASLAVRSIAIALAILAPLSAHAIVLDLATSSNGSTPNTTSGAINGAVFQWTDFNATGTGLIQTFVQVQARNSEQGYNTTENGVFDNGSSDVFNHEVLLSDIPIVNIGGVNYREFLLDINEPSATSKPLLSLDEIQVFQSNTANTDVETFTNSILNIPGGRLAYRLDSAASDNRIELNAALNSGSGAGDMFMYIPTSAFVGNYQYVYLYSAFGSPNAAHAGFEEWAHRIAPAEDTDVVPEPATLSLFGIGLAGMVARKLRKRK